MIKIRNFRFKKINQSNRQWINFVKVIGIFYVLVITVAYLSSNTDTGAYFNDSDQTTVSFPSPVVIWDKSSLVFPNSSNGQIINSCDSVNISVVIKNVGNNMDGVTQYEVYWIASGNPKQGEKVGEGIINPLNSNQTATLTYLATNPGEYKFRAFQRPGHNWDYENRKDLWSETIKVVCNQEPQRSNTPVTPKQPATTNQPNQPGQVVNESTSNTNQVSVEQPVIDPEKSSDNEVTIETIDKTVESNQGAVNK